jgi:hypothetical protein
MAGNIAETKDTVSHSNPEWMEVETLQKILKYEQDSDTFSKDLPFRYQEMFEITAGDC